MLKLKPLLLKEPQMNSEEVKVETTEVHPQGVPVVDEPEHETAPVAETVIHGDGNCLLEVEYSSNIQGAVDNIALPSDTAKRTRDIVSNIPNVNMLDNPESRKWATALTEGLTRTMYSDVFGDTVTKPGSNFTQKVEYKGINLNAAAPRFKPLENQQIKGERAIIRMITQLGLGTLIQVPLWHTGIWVTIKPPSEAELLELNRLMLSDKIRFGRFTHSLAFSNTSSYTTDRLTDFVLSHVYDTTLKSEDLNTELLKNIIVSQDIPTLIWGLMCSVYPRGFKYQRACVADPEKCHHVLEETLNLSKLQWVNTAPLTDWQKSHMASRQARSKDLASVTRYKEELAVANNKKVSIDTVNGSKIFFTLRTPSIKEYVDAGHVWISDMVEIMEKAITTETSQTERESLLTKYGQASAMRQYRHWVECVEIDSNVISDPETLSQCLDVLSSEDVILSDFIKEIIKYIGESTISVIGIPVYDCPACGKKQEVEHKLPRHTNIIPLDTMTVFFDLYTQRLTRLTER
jgi:hypothetical protein